MRTPRYWAWICAFGVGAVLSGCSVYDSDLLHHPNLKPRARGTGGTNASDSGMHEPSDKDGAVASDSSSPNEFPTSDSGAPLQTRCGDGLVSGEETCDIAIEAGAPGACPTESDCTPLGACALRAVNNANSCHAECITLEASCKSDDGCCPMGCTRASDSDCSASCHDGIVQTDQGETCEPESQTQPCKTAADCDDGDACTSDGISGSPDNCNVQCTHAPVTMLHAGDQCCPKGGNNNTDSDCPAVCGNGVQEAGEVCDGSEGCSSDCKSKATTNPPPKDPPPACDVANCTDSCFPIGVLNCCTDRGTCGCTWAPGAYCM